MTACPTVHGVYQMHLAKGRDTLVTIALPPNQARRLLEALGPAPSLAKQIPVTMAVGRPAAVLGELLADGDPGAPAPEPGPAPADEPFDLGRAVCEIAFLTVQAAMWADIVNSQHGHARAFALDQRDLVTTRLDRVQREVTDAVQAVLGRVR